jgi:flagellar protein FlgJ
MSDLSSISSLSVSDYLTQAQSSQSTSALEQTLSQDYSNATDEELMDVCKDFESYFVEQLIKSMESTLDEDSDPLSGSYSYFKDMQTQEYAELMTEQNDFGIAQTLYEQMKRNYSL